MRKYLAVAATVGAVSILYLLMLIVVPFLVDTTVSVNATLHSSSNMSLYPGTTDFLVAIPWICWFLPACLGIVVVLGILRSDL